MTLTLAHGSASGKGAALLNPLPGGAAPALSVPARRADGSTTAITAELTSVPAARYIVRAEIDGATSLPGMGHRGFDGPIADLDP